MRDASGRYRTGQRIGRFWDKVEANPKVVAVLLASVVALGLLIWCLWDEIVLGFRTDRPPFDQSKVLRVPPEGKVRSERTVWISPNPRKSLNRHDAKAAKDATFRSFHRRTREPVPGAFRSFVPFPPIGHFLLAFLATWRLTIVKNFGLGLALVKAQALTLLMCSQILALELRRVGLLLEGLICLLSQQNICVSPGGVLYVQR